ncbi:MAG: nickel-dependent lactate racemase [bacterium]|nr:nickel-dependent lactate racemase [bacterium]
MSFPRRREHFWVKDMLINLPYGRNYLSVEVPATSQVLEVKSELPVLDAEIEIRKGLQFPIGTEPLADIIVRKKAKNASIVVSDHTRPVPNSIILPPILEELERSGISPKNITILIATGMHRPTTEAEQIELLGEKIHNNYQIIVHDHRDNSSLVKIEVTGRPVSLNKFYLGSDIKILTGFIEPHFMTGFSGGRKAICPGISGVETIQYFHGPVLLESPYATSGNLVNNPCHEFAIAVANQVGVDFIVNVTLDRQKKITGVFCGDLITAYLAGVKYCESYSTVELDEPVDIVITTNGGYPLDRDFYQTAKGLVGVLEIVREGGLILCASECSDGIGSAEFKRLLFAMQEPDKFLEMIKQPGYYCIDQWGVEELVKVLKKARVKLYSTGLTPEEIRRCHIDAIASIEEGIKQGIAEYGTNAKIAVVPDGPYTLTKTSKKKI